MKVIVDYIHYLITKPVKVLWLIAVMFITQLIGFCIFSGEIYAENETLVVVLLAVFITCIHFVANLQPFCEWRDAGKPKGKK